MGPPLMDWALPVQQDMYGNWHGVLLQGRVCEAAPLENGKCGKINFLLFLLFF
jgi:hypothetical protein